MTITTRDDDVWLHTRVADVALGVPSLGDASVDLIFTSPPYKKRDGWSVELMQALGAVAQRVLKPDGRLFVNFGQLSEDFSRALEVPGYIEAGSGADDALVQAQTYVWIKSIAIGDRTHGHLQPIHSQHILSYCWEFVFQFVKAFPRPLDRLAVGVPFVDKSNLTRGGRGKNGDLRDAGDTWHIPYETRGRASKKAHPYEFPAELVRRAIRVASLDPGSVVCDLFGGSGQVARVAKQEGHNALLIDRDEGLLEEARQRWREA